MRIIDPNPSWSPYPIGRAALEACRAIDRDVSFFLGGFAEEPIPTVARPPDAVRCIAPEDRWTKPNGAPRVLEVGTAPTECISLPYVEFEVSDGVPTAIGADEATKPKSAPPSSVPVFTDGFTTEERAFFAELDGSPNSKGMKW
jgi:hypothetical protein